MAGKPHPNYPNPTIIEALCEFQITPTEWRVSRPAPLFPVLGEEFPNFEPISDMGIQIRVGPSGPTQEVVNKPARLRFSTEDKKRLVQATDTVFTFNFLAPYPGWENVLPSILTNWEKLCTVVKPKEIVRVGLRYINKIPRTGEHARVSDWLKPTRHLPPAIIESVDPFLARIEAKRDERNLTVITLSSETTMPAVPHPSIILDLDRVALGNTPPDRARIGEIIEGLHNDAWDEFEEAMTPQLQRFLENKQ
jgi:uncharacterized protein (TIGR04255 family)